MTALCILLGLWIVVSPWILRYGSASATASSIIAGTAIIVFGFIHEIAPESKWPSWIIFTVGLWLAVSPFLLQPDAALPYWNLVISGLAISLVSYMNIQINTLYPAM